MTALKRGALLAAGWLSFGLGGIGIFLPGLPTTIFWILAALAFMRSDPRMYARIVGHRRFGPPIRLFVEEGRIGPRAKLISIASMVASAILCLLVLPVLWVKILVVAVIALGVAWVSGLPSSGARSPAVLPGSLAEGEGLDP